MVNKRLVDKVVVITGATKGIGRGIALMAAREGARVVINGRDKAQGETLVAEIQERYAVDAHVVYGDISDVAVCKQLIDETVERFGRVDGLVNNAGIFPRGSLLETEESLFDAVFSINVKGAFFCTQYALRAMINSGGGSIVNIGSTHGFGGSVDLAAYACSKGALHTLTQHVARNYVHQRIRANYITVGWVITPGEIAVKELEGKDLQWLKAQEARIPSGRMQTEEDIAYGVVYLLSDESSQVFGTDLHITGGFVPN